MTSYFDEHDCEPLGENEAPDHYLHLARLLLDFGAGAEFNFSFNRTFGDETPPPPASKHSIEELKSTIKRNAEGSCTICLKQFEPDEKVMELPCKHEFHDSCILPWLEKTNSCPVCRFELPTDNAEYEEHKREKKRAEQRQADAEERHDSMFS